MFCFDLDCCLLLVVAVNCCLGVCVDVVVAIVAATVVITVVLVLMIRHNNTYKLINIY